MSETKATPAPVVLESATPKAPTTVITEGYEWRIGWKKFVRHAAIPFLAAIGVSAVQWLATPGNAVTLLGTSPKAVAAASILAGAAGFYLNYRTHKDDVPAAISVVPLGPDPEK